MKCLTTAFAAAALIAPALIAGTALAQFSPPMAAGQSMQSGAVTGGTSWATRPRLDPDKPEADKKDGAAASQEQTAGDKKTPDTDKKDGATAPQNQTAGDKKTPDTDKK